MENEQAKAAENAKSEMTFEELVIVLNKQASRNLLIADVLGAVCVLAGVAMILFAIFW